MLYLVKRTDTTPKLQGLWDGPVWREAVPVPIQYFHPSSGDHRPVTQAKVLYDESDLYVIFKVQDKYVRSVHTQTQDMVCQDSCVELFLQPKHDKGYFNVEVNAGGTLLMYYIEDPTRVDGGFAQYEPVNESDTNMIKIFHSMPEVVDPEITEPQTWVIELRIPFLVFESYVGSLGEIFFQRWRGNFYKCGDKTSHPHWASWAPIGQELNFHQPKRFGTLQFE